MLVLSRRTGAGDRSTICIGSDMEITLIEVCGEEVRIGVKAPREAVVEGCALWKQMTPVAGGTGGGVAGDH